MVTDRRLKIIALNMMRNLYGWTFTKDSMRVQHRFLNLNLHIKTSMNGLGQYRPTALFAINRPVQEQILQDLAHIRKENEPDFHIDVAAITNQTPSSPDDFMVALALQSDEMLGATAMKILIDRINGKTSDAPVSKNIPMEIVDLKSDR